MICFDQGQSVTSGADAGIVTHEKLLERRREVALRTDSVPEFRETFRRNAYLGRRPVRLVAQKVFDVRRNRIDQIERNGNVRSAIGSRRDSGPVSLHDAHIPSCGEAFGDLPPVSGQMHIERIPAECAIQPPQKPAQTIVDLDVSRRIIQTAETVCRDAAFMCSGEIADVRAGLREVVEPHRPVQSTNTFIRSSVATLPQSSQPQRRNGSPPAPAGTTGRRRMRINARTRMAGRALSAGA